MEFISGIVGGVFMSYEGGCHVQQIQRQAHMGHGPRHYFLERER